VPRRATMLDGLSGTRVARLAAVGAQANKEEDAA